jgi:hypothetical protein
LSDARGREQTPARILLHTVNRWPTGLFNLAALRLAQVERWQRG